jgi:hypothetical protein
MAKNLFSSVKSPRIKKNVFNLSHENKLSLNMGELIPILCQEVVPGDRFRVRTDLLLRFAPMLAPIMHRVNVYTHFFFVPNRIIWDEWEDFITGGKDGTKKPVFPNLSGQGATTWKNWFPKGELGDYLGVPPITDPDGSFGAFHINALPFRAYNMIYNEYYRDQNLEDPVSFSVASGNISSPGELLYIKKRSWEKDYFTSALPWAQRGEPVNLPLGGSAPVTVAWNDSGMLSEGMKVRPINNQDKMYSTHNVLGLNMDESGPESSTSTLMNTNVKTGGAVGLDKEVVIDPNGTLEADLSEATGITINDLRRSVKLQEWLERNARGGARYIEQILSHFGVVSSDARLQRPEYLGGGKSPVVISEVLQTSATDETSPQANMSGHGVSAGSSHQFTKFFEEHGYIMGILSVIPKSAYQQGLPKIFSKLDKFDYYFPEFAHLGEQPILNKELYISLRNESEVKANEEVFGYTPRYAEYKYIPSQVHGDFRDDLDFWHLGRIFTSRPALSRQFVQVDWKSLNRIFAVESSASGDLDHIWVQLYNDVKAIRPMPKFGTPYL